MSDLRKTLIQAYQAGQFLEVVSAVLSRNRKERSAVASELAALHNERLVNVVEAFAGVKARSKSGTNFSLVRAFAEALPQLEAPVPEVIRCALHLCLDPAVTMMDLLDGFQKFCSKQNTRPQEALAEIEANPDTLADLLAPTLVAGSQIDASTYLDEAIRFCQHQNVELRRRAVFAIGRLTLGDDITLADLALTTLERVVETDTDDGVLASGITSAFALLGGGAARQFRCVAVISRALSRGNECALDSASRLFGFHTNDLSPQLLQVLLDHLLQVKPTNKGTLENIDSGISQLLQGPHADTGLQFLEDLLLAHPGELVLKTFESTVEVIRDRAEFRGKVLTRWLLRGVYTLCEGLDTIVGSPVGDSLEVEVDKSQLVSSAPVSLIILAQKAIGYLFSMPISAASFLISLMHNSKEDTTVRELSDLLLDPLLLNSSGSVRGYVAQQAKSESGHVKTALDQALRSFEEYLEGLRSVGDIPALYPSEAHREAYRRHFSELVTESFKTAEAESDLLRLFPKTVLLYGRKAVHYAYGPQGSSSRMETPLKSYRTEIEVPCIFDPCGLDYMLRVFRSERLKT